MDGSGDVGIADGLSKKPAISAYEEGLSRMKTKAQDPLTASGAPQPRPNPSARPPLSAVVKRVIQEQVQPAQQQQQQQPAQPQVLELQHIEVGPPALLGQNNANWLANEMEAGLLVEGQQQLNPLFFGSTSLESAGGAGGSLANTAAAAMHFDSKTDNIEAKADISIVPTFPAKPPAPVQPAPPARTYSRRPSTDASPHANSGGQSTSKMVAVLEETRMRTRGGAYRSRGNVSDSDSDDDAPQLPPAAPNVTPSTLVSTTMVQQPAIKPVLAARLEPLTKLPSQQMGSSPANAAQTQVNPATAQLVQNLQSAPGKPAAAELHDQYVEHWANTLPEPALAVKLPEHSFPHQPLGNDLLATPDFAPHLPPVAPGPSPVQAAAVKLVGSLGSDVLKAAGESKQAASKHTSWIPRPSKEGRDPPGPPIKEQLEERGALALFEEKEENINKDEDDEDGPVDEEEHVVWYKRTSMRWFISTMAICVVLLLVGVILQNVVVETTAIEAFRWCYFFAAWPVLFYLIRMLMQQAFALIEWMFFRESLYYLISIQSNSTWLIFFIVQLPWFKVIFRWAWCNTRKCQASAYKQATEIVWSCLLCLTLWCLANFLKAVIAKMLSTHFYRTAHFKKLKTALEKEYYLQMLSRPRRRVEEEKAAAAEIAEGPAAWFSTMWHHTGKPKAPAEGDLQHVDSSNRLDSQGRPVDDVAVDVSTAPPNAQPGTAAYKRTAAPEEIRLEVQPSLNNNSPDHPTAALRPAGSASLFNSNVLQTAAVNDMHQLLTGHDSKTAAPPSKGAGSKQNSKQGSKLPDSKAEQVRRQESKMSQRSKNSKATNTGTNATKNNATNLIPEVVQSVPHPLTEKKAVKNMSDAELEKVRTAIVIKTYTALVRKHANRSHEEEEKELHSVKRFAKALFYNVRADEERDYVTQEDFDFLFDDLETSKKAFAVFDQNNDNQVSRKEVKECITAMYKERHNMAMSLTDTDSIVNSLEFGIGICIHFIFIAFYLLVWNVDLLAGFSTFSATVLALTFVFGNSVKNMFESMLFLFVEHPYDVGDCVFIANEFYRVKKISIMYTELIRGTGERTWQPNTRLMQEIIINWTRSSTKVEVVKLVVDMGVEWDVRLDIQNAMQDYAKEHRSEFDGNPEINYIGADNPMKMILVAAWVYNFAPDAFDRLGPMRNGMMYVLQQKLMEHKIRYTVQETVVRKGGNEKDGAPVEFVATGF